MNPRGIRLGWLYGSYSCLVLWLHAGQDADPLREDGRGSA